MKLSSPRIYHYLVAGAVVIILHIPISSAFITAPGTAYPRRLFHNNPKMTVAGDQSIIEPSRRNQKHHNNLSANLGVRTGLSQQHARDEEDNTRTPQPETEIQPRPKPEWVPKTRGEAIRVFFFSEHGIGPLIVSLALAKLLVWRLTPSSLMGPLSVADLLAFVGTIVFWSFQEHVLHQRFLHSKLDWYGKSIHQGHHEKPYFHISIDPPHLMLGWMGAVHLLFRYFLPLPIAISATLGYSLAGLFYEWAHYIVHTKVKPSSDFWRTLRDNHMRHHCVDDRFWYAFSLPAIDDMFGTNPPIAQVRALKQREKLATTAAAAAAAGASD